MKRIPRVVFAVFLVAVAYTGNTYAQWLDSLSRSYNNPGSALIGTIINNRIMEDATKRAAEREGGKPGEPPAPPVPSTSARLTFQPVAKNLMVEKLAQALTNEPTTQRRLSKAFEAFLEQFDWRARHDQEPVNDVSRAAAHFVLLNYFAATGKGPTDAQGEGVWAQYRATLAQDATFAQMTDSDRQRLYETLVIFGSLMPVEVAMAGQEKDRLKEARCRVFAAQLLQSFVGVPAERIQLTATGFTIVR